MAQQYFTDSEWSTLMQAPFEAIKAMVLADKTDPVSFLKEAKAAIAILVAEQQRTDLTSDLASSLLASMKEKDAAETLQNEELLLKKQFQFLGDLQMLKDASEGRKQSLEYFKQVGTILAAKVTAVQASEFKSWILSIARKVAEAVKEGGFLGVGGERISGEEQSMLKEMEKALEIKL